MNVKKYGWTEKGILGFIFSPMGLIFLAIGLALSNTPFVDPRERALFLCVFCGVGGVFLLLGLIFLFLELRRRRRQKAAFEGGYYVMAKIADVKVITRVNLNGAHPMVVECHYKDGDTVHVYYSRYLYFSVADMLTQDEVPVYIDRGDPDAYYVDIDAALPRVEVHR